jgi:hypothetical protein
MGLMERVNCSLKREEWETVIDLSLAQHLARIQGCRIVVWDGLIDLVPRQMFAPMPKWA